MKAFITQREYIELNEKPIVLLYGRLENQESFVSMNEFHPFFYIKEKEVSILKKINKEQEIKILKTDLSSFKQEKVVKLEFKNQKHLNEISHELRDFNIETFEEDLKPATRFAIEKEILDVIELKGEYQNNERVTRLYENPEISAGKENIKLKTISLDIESGKENQELYCIGLYSEEIQEVFMNTREKIPGVISCNSERECLEKFKERIIEIDPDIITGWNVIDFDFVFLKKKFEEHNIPFDIGRNNKPLRLRIEKKFLKKSSIDIPGRVVLDGLGLIRDPFIKEAPSIKNLRFDSYSLEDISQQIIGKTKLITGKDRHKEIDKLFNGTKTQKKKLAEYNLQDCKLVYEILEKTKIIELAMERSSLTGMSIDRITASIASFDSLYIREAKKRGFVSPSAVFKSKSEKIMGGFVTQPIPGVYENVLVLDFKSLYPSIIRTFNIDPASFLEKKEKNCIVSPNQAFFKNQEGILPKIIQRLYEAREKAKKEKRELSSYAIKVIMSSFFGILASQNSRYFNMQIGNAITTFGQEIIKLTRRKVEEKGFKVIYGDTDSIFIETDKTQIEAEQLAETIPEEINSFYEKYIQKEYKRRSFLTLEFDKLYLKLIIPRIRQGKNEEENEKGAKKRYAGLIEQNKKEVLDMVGLEAVRGDWTEAAQEFQKKLVLRVFQKEDPIKFIKDFLKKMKNRELDKKLIYRKSIRKNLEEYTKTTPPHVKAARKLKELEGTRIEYYMTTKGPEPIQELKNKIDYEHYIEKQIKPLARTILETVGIDFETAFSDFKQKTLF